MVRWDGTVVLRTERLTLRTFTRDDLPAYAALNAHPDVYRWLGGSPIPRETSDEIAEWANHLHETEGIGLMAVERTADGAFLGMCGLHHQESFPDDVEVAWRLAPQHWGNGYATEAARAWLGHAFGALGLPQVISLTEPGNERSIAVMRRLGLRFDRAARVVDEGEEFDAVVWCIDALEWAARSGRA